MMESTKCKKKAAECMESCSIMLLLEILEGKNHIVFIMGFFLFKY